MVVIFSDHFYENMQRTGKAQFELLTDGTVQFGMTLFRMHSIHWSLSARFFKIPQFPFGLLFGKIRCTSGADRALLFVPGIWG
jgi:hypothetical protein